MTDAIGLTSAAQALATKTSVEASKEVKAEDHVMAGGEEAEADGNEDEEIRAMKARVREMEEEAANLRSMHQELEAQSSELGLGREDKEDIDSRSIFVGNVDYSATPEEVQTHFQSCGSINRVTILLDKFTGTPKGYAYVEFSEPSNVAQALVLNDSIFHDRPLKVVPKRTNLPGMHRGRGGRGRGGYRGGRGPRGGYRGGSSGYRGRGRGHFSPY